MLLYWKNVLNASVFILRVLLLYAYVNMPKIEEQNCYTRENKHLCLMLISLSVSFSEVDNWHKSCLQQQPDVNGFCVRGAYGDSIFCGVVNNHSMQPTV